MRCVSGGVSAAWCQQRGVSNVVSDVRCQWRGVRRGLGGLETGGRTTRASVCRPPFRKTAPPSCLWRLPCGDAPFGCFKSVLLRLTVPLYRVSDNEQVPLVYKRNRQDGDSGTTFRIMPVGKLSDTRRVRGQRRFLSDNTPCEVV
jgi:hypothetical protein